MKYITKAENVAEQALMIQGFGSIIGVPDGNIVNELILDEARSMTIYRNIGRDQAAVAIQYEDDSAAFIIAQTRPDGPILNVADMVIANSENDARAKANGYARRRGWTLDQSSKAIEAK